MSDFKTHIAKVASGASLTFDEARDAFDIVMSGEATPSQIGGFLMALRVRGETVEEISGAVATMRVSGVGIMPRICCTVVAVRCRGARGRALDDRVVMGEGRLRRAASVSDVNVSQLRA